MVETSLNIKTRINLAFLRHWAISMDIFFRLAFTLDKSRIYEMLGIYSWSSPQRSSYSISISVINFLQKCLRTLCIRPIVDLFQ